MENYIVLDVDATNMMAKVTSGGRSHLSELLSHYDASFMHKFVLSEVHQGKIIRHVRDLIGAGFIEIWDDRDLLSHLKDIYIFEETTCKKYIEYYKDVLGLYPIDHPLQAVNNPITTTNYVTTQKLVDDLEAADASISSKMDTGEFKSTILILGLIECYQDVKFFLSNDRKARKICS
jgi:hypothetical protein